MLKRVHIEWRPLLQESLLQMDTNYLQQLDNHDWLPGRDALFAAFREPLSSIRYILLGESPYPRSQSANGYAFWDAAVDSLWSPTGLSTAVNKATSLRNLLKMLLYASGDLDNDFSQTAIARLDRTQYVQTGMELFGNFIRKQFLLLNASLVYSANEVPFHARQWRPFMCRLLNLLSEENAQLRLVLLGNIARKIDISPLDIALIAEHPYNVSFITNPAVVNFFKPMDLLHAY